MVTTKKKKTHTISKKDLNHLMDICLDEIDIGKAKGNKTWVRKQQQILRDLRKQQNQ